MNEIQPFDRNEQLVFAEVAQLHELLHGVADADLFEADETSDAVIHVHDQVFDFQIAQIGKKCFGNGPMAVALAFDLGAFLLEDVRLRNNLQLGARQPESLRELPNGDVHRDVQQLVRPIDQNASEAVLAEELRGAFGASLCGGHEHDGVAALTHALDFGDPLLNTAAKFDGGLAGDV